MIPGRSTAAALISLGGQMRRTNFTSLRCDNTWDFNLPWSHSAAQATLHQQPSPCSFSDSLQFSPIHLPFLHLPCLHPFSSWGDFTVFSMLGRTLSLNCWTFYTLRTSPPTAVVTSWSGLSHCSHYSSHFQSPPEHLQPPCRKHRL